MFKQLNYTFLTGAKNTQERNRERAVGGFAWGHCSEWDCTIPTEVALRSQQDTRVKHTLVRIHPIPGGLALVRHTASLKQL